MTNSRICTASGLAVAAVMLSPLIVIVLIPLTIGIGLHLFERFGEAPFALLLCVPTAFVLLRRFSAPAPAARYRSGELDDAVGSIG